MPHLRPCAIVSPLLWGALCLSCALIHTGCRAERPAPQEPPTPLHAPADAASPAPTPRVEGAPETHPKPTAATPAAPVRVATPEAVRGLLRAGRRAEAVATLEVSLDTWGDAADRRAGRYMLARTLLEDDDPRALAHFEALPAPFEGFDALRLEGLARAQLGAGRDAEAVKTLGQLLADHAEALPDMAALRLERARALRRLGQTGEALREARAVDAPPALRAEALRLEAELVRAEQPELAERLERALLTRFPHHDAALRPGLQLTPDALSDAERFARAEALMRGWSYDAARDLFRQLKDHPRHGLDARWNIAVISLRKLRDDADEAEAMLRPMLKLDDAARVEEAYYLLMRAHMKRERYDDALKLADRYDAAFPKGRYRERTAYYRGWLPYDRGDCAAAQPHLKRYVKTHRAKRAVVHGFWAWCFIRTERWDDAARAFGELVPYGNPLVRGKAYYWRAYALHRLGRDAEALEDVARLQKEYPLTYYGVLGLQLAAQIQGRDPRASAQPWPEGGGDAEARHAVDPDLWALPQLKGATARGLARVRRLVELGEVGLARRAYLPLRERVEAAVPASRKLAWVRFMGQQVDDYRRGWSQVTGGRLAAMTDMPDPADVRWLLAYPQAWRPLVERLAAEHGLPSALIYAIMRQESRYTPTAVSGADAVGALQMIPATARKVAADMGVAYNPRTFARPDVGFAYSAFYIARHRDLWRGQLVPTAASYNGGPEPIARWLRARPGAPLPFVIEEFAYNESRIYCRKVAEHMLRYLYLYEPDPAARGRWLDALFPVTVRADLPDDVGY